MLQYLRGGLGDCVFGFVYLMEFSTIFVSFSGILSKMKVSLWQFHCLQYLVCSLGRVFHVVSMFQMKSSQFYIINGLVMLVTFFFFRVVMFPYVFYRYSRIAGLSFWEVRISGPCVLTVFAWYFHRLDQKISCTEIRQIYPSGHFKKSSWILSTFNTIEWCQIWLAFVIKMGRVLGAGCHVTTNTWDSAYINIYKYYVGPFTPLF